MMVIIRAYNADGYHKDIAIMDEQQVRMLEGRCVESQSWATGLIGVGIGIKPEDFPEMVRFDVVIKEGS